MGLAFTFLIYHILTEVFGREREMEAYVSRRIVSAVIVKYGGTTERRLKIGTISLKER